LFLGLAGGRRYDSGPAGFQRAVIFLIFLERYR